MEEMYVFKIHKLIFSSLVKKFDEALALYIASEAERSGAKRSEAERSGVEDASKLEPEEEVEATPDMYLAKVNITLSNIENQLQKKIPIFDDKHLDDLIVNYLRIATQYVWLLKLDISHLLDERNYVKYIYRCPNGCERCRLEEWDDSLFCTTCGVMSKNCCKEEISKVINLKKMFKQPTLV